MFVFGSSYVDTGNVNPGDTARPYPWSKPYGETWPRKPAGRYSDGHVLTDAIAQALKLRVPTTFRGAKGAVKQANGVNFAEGGSGVLPTVGFAPISSQIDAFQSLVSTYTPQELASAIVLYCTAGDDYFQYLTSQPSLLSNIYPLTVSVGKQISVDLVKLYGLGLRKFMVTYLPPTGCLPIACGENFYQSCNDTWTTNIAQPHNARVFKNVLGLRHYFKNGTILLLDLFSAFNSTQSTIGNGGLKPCCVGNNSSSKCSSLGARGILAYSLCSNPSSQFYWDDMIHPTEAGWQAVVKQLQPTLNQIIK
eukprot:c10389_g1_i2 orf=113-1033(-)